MNYGESGGHVWLTVNVSSPQPEAGAALPVMVWIYGGAYQLEQS